MGRAIECAREIDHRMGRGAIKTAIRGEVGAGRFASAEFLRRLWGMIPNVETLSDAVCGLAESDVLCKDFKFRAGDGVH